MARGFHAEQEDCYQCEDQHERPIQFTNHSLKHSHTEHCWSWLTLSLLSSKSTFSQTFKEKCIIEVVRIGSIIIFHLRKLWKTKFFILCDVTLLVRGNLILITLDSESVCNQTKCLRHQMTHLLITSLITDQHWTAWSTITNDWLQFLRMNHWIQLKFFSGSAKQSNFNDWSGVEAYWPIRHEKIVILMKKNNS